jgi:hypothetical protein
MKRYVGFSLIVVAVVAFAATQAFARGGGHGGGHHGGGHHGGHHAHHSSHHHSHHSHHANRHHHVAHHHNGHRAFSHGWYNHHHGAWGWGNGGYGWGNPWAAATLGATAGWLGANALDWGNYGYPATTVYTGNDDAGAQPVNSEIVNNEESGDAASDPQTADSDESNDADEPAVSKAEATALAAQGGSEPAKDVQFLPLGVYTIAPSEQNDATAMLHLAVSKEGVLRGSFVDLKTDKDQTIQGAVDKKTGLVAWTVPAEGKVVFQTSMKDLTEQSGPLEVHFANGKSDTWTIARYSEKDAQEDEAKTSTDGEQTATPETKTGSAAETK